MLFVGCVQQGIVEEQAGGNAVLYRLNCAHLAAPAVVELADVWAVLLERLTAELSDWPVRPRFAALFGSAARGTSGPDSDIDVFLVAPSHDHLREEWATSVRLLEASASR